MLKKLIVSLVLTGFVLAGCSATGTQIPALPTELPPGVPTGLPPLDEIVPPDMARTILDKVSEIVGVPVESAQLKSVEPMDWPDSCLGLGEPNETCAQTVTSGWLLVFDVNGQEFRIRVDQTGTVIRREP
jgi:hypothetical protein